MSTQVQVVGDTCKRASTEGPDYCATCSAKLGDWVPWEGHTHREAALISNVRHRLREYGEARCELIHAEHEQMGRALARMVTDHPFVLDGDNGAMVASWFICEARNAIGPATDG